MNAVTELDLRLTAAQMLRYDEERRNSMDRLIDGLRCLDRSSDAPPWVKGEIPIRLDKPRGVAFHVPRECLGLPGFAPASRFENGARQ